ncbi:hypothetical protein FACS1894180_8900 [Bacteroidia bacterium]|nr:hypothetical protein FACS1894180_8900 [Bacteroidia bacterium]
MKTVIKFLPILTAIAIMGFACKNQVEEPKKISISAAKVSECKSSSIDKSTLAKAVADFSPIVTAKTVGSSLQITVVNIVFGCGLEEVLQTINVNGNVIDIDLQETGEAVRATNCICEYDVELLLEGLTFGTTYTINITRGGLAYYSFEVPFESGTDLSFNVE